MGGDSIINGGGGSPRYSGPVPVDSGAPIPTKAHLGVCGEKVLPRGFWSADAHVRPQPVGSSMVCVFSGSKFAHDDVGTRSPAFPLRKKEKGYWHQYIFGAGLVLVQSQVGSLYCGTNVLC